MNELKLYNPELLHKPRLLAITKSDLLDAELEKLLKRELPKDIEYIFISSITGKNIQQLKDKIWKMLNE
jgi:GTP-binding protein